MIVSKTAAASISTLIAEIQHGYSDPATKMFRVNGKPAIGIGVNMRSGGNNLTFGEGLHHVDVRLRERAHVAPPQVYHADRNAPT